MDRRILITGACGLVGTALARALAADGTEVVRLDLRDQPQSRGDVRDAARVQHCIAGVDGIIHLAAVSRVVWGERDPESCRATNVGGVRNVIAAALSSPRRPWLVFASSREVYGEPDTLPTTEDAPLRPINVYGRTKVEGERLVAHSQREGLRSAILRLSNVYGSPIDHRDRVIPGFARAAAIGSELRVDGVDHTFDFTHVDDVARGVVATTRLLMAHDRSPPPIHLVSGRATTLGELATLAARLGRPECTVRQAPPRTYDVARFVGDPARAKALLGWQATVSLEDGLARLVRAYQQSPRLADGHEVTR